jgi:alkylated DNA repair dioxygenase AlkB
VLRQLDLFATGAPAFDAEFRACKRITLTHGAWVDHVPGWVSGHDALFDELEQGLDWRRETMKMYDKTVTVPRLLASVPDDGAGQPLIRQMRDAISARYREQFVFSTAALYRDGHDSVAFHGDTTARDMLEALVATVSLGEPRRFILKPTEGGESIESPRRHSAESAPHHSAPLRASAEPRLSIALPLGRGDLVVMGGTCQRTWRHGIPKVAHAGPRIALMFRPSWARNYRTSVTDR